MAKGVGLCACLGNSSCLKCLHAFLGTTYNSLDDFLKRGIEMIFPPSSRHYYQPPSYQYIQQPSHNTHPLQSIWKRFLPNINSTRTTGTISNVLTHMQSILKVVETTAPLIKQYGPIIRSLPTMFQMLKAFQEMESVDETENNRNSEADVHVNEVTNSDNSDTNNVGENIKMKQQTRQSGESVPKLFI